MTCIHLGLGEDTKHGQHKGQRTHERRDRREPKQPAPATAQKKVIEGEEGQGPSRLRHCSRDFTEIDADDGEVRENGKTLNVCRKEEPDCEPEILALTPVLPSKSQCKGAA